MPRYTVQGGEGAENRRVPIEGTGQLVTDARWGKVICNGKQVKGEEKILLVIQVISFGLPLSAELVGGIRCLDFVSVVGWKEDRDRAVMFGFKIACEGL